MTHDTQRVRSADQNMFDIAKPGHHPFGDVYKSDDYVYGMLMECESNIYVLLEYEWNIK